MRRGPIGADCHRLDRLAECVRRLASDAQQPQEADDGECRGRGDDKQGQEEDEQKERYLADANNGS